MRLLTVGSSRPLPRFPYRRVSVKIKVLLRLITTNISRGVSPNLDEKVSRRVPRRNEPDASLAAVGRQHLKAGQDGLGVAGVYGVVRIGGLNGDGHDVGVGVEGSCHHQCPDL